MTFFGEMLKFFRETPKKVVKKFRLKLAPGFRSSGSASVYIQSISISFLLFKSSNLYRRSRVQF